MENGDCSDWRAVVGSAQPSPADAVTAHGIDAEHFDGQGPEFVLLAVQNSLLALEGDALQSGPGLAHQGIDRLGSDVGAVGHELLGNGVVVVGGNVVDVAIDEVGSVRLGEAVRPAMGKDARDADEENVQELHGCCRLVDVLSMSGQLLWTGCLAGC